MHLPYLYFPFKNFNRQSVQYDRMHKNDKFYIVHCAKMFNDIVCPLIHISGQFY